MSPPALGTQRVAPRERQLMQLARIVGGSVVLAGLLILAGWIFDSDLLRRLPFNLEPVRPVACIGFIALGLAESLHDDSSRRFRRPVIVFAALASSIGLLTLVSYGIDLQAGTSAPAFLTNRVSPISASSFALLGGAYLLKYSGRRITAHACALFVLAVCYAALMGRIHGVEALYRVGPSAIQTQTATLFVLSSIACLLGEPRTGLARMLTDDGSAGVLVRRLLPLALLLAPAVDVIQRWSGSGLPTVMANLLSVAFLVYVVLHTAASVHGAETQRAAAMNEVRTSEERLRVALQAASGGSWDWDLAADKAWWSPEMYALWRVEPGLAMHRENSINLIEPADREGVARSIAAAVAHGGRYQCEFRLARAGGPEIWMSSRGQVHYDASGKPVRLVGISLDVTAQKATETSLRHSKEALERSNRELQRFLYTASHDLQTPLRNVSSYTELLQTAYGPALERRGQDWLQRVAVASAQMRGLVNGLLASARTAARIRHRESVALQEVLGACAQRMAPEITACGAKITSDALPEVVCDATDMSELLTHLLDNAIKYRGADPPRIHLSASQTAVEWQISVHDNGIGIDPRYHEQIFGMFERLHNAERYSGHGVGLAICRLVVESCGGRIWVRSELGRGSDFYFSIPK